MFKFLFVYLHKIKLMAQGNGIIRVTQTITRETDLDNFILNITKLGYPNEAIISIVFQNNLNTITAFINTNFLT